MADPTEPHGSEQPSLGGLVEQVMQLGQRLGLAQADAGEVEVEGSAGGGAVRIVASGDGEFRSVRIDPAAVDATDVSLLEDLVLAALHDVTEKVEAARQASMSGLGELLGGGLGDLLGGEGVDRPDDGGS
ncbi:MAG TPA: YbaB/EbfC family nucleoid-associated protein [Acidimicrobiales bacterium]